MKAIAGFRETISRCNQLVELFHTVSPKNDDLLRFAVVLAVSAFEKYVKDSFVERLVQFARLPSAGKSKREEFDAFLKGAGVEPDLWRECYNARGKNPNPNLRMRNRVKRELSSKPIQRQTDISELFKLYGLGNILVRARELSNKALIWKTIEKTTKRRHQIVHASDYRFAGSLEPINDKNVNRHLAAFERFVESMNSILESRFKKKRRKSIPKRTKSHVKSGRRPTKGNCR